MGKVDHAINREAIKALVAVYGQQEAARQAGIPYGTVSSWCHRFKWKKMDVLPRTNGINGNPCSPETRKRIDEINNALIRAREASTINLAKYVDKAAKKAARHKDPLSIARRVRDVASVHETLFPKEKEGGIIEGGILIGAMVVKDDPKEIMANVREVVSDTRPEGN
jgi:hypothetical protein